MEPEELSDLQLLSCAVQDAMDAYRTGLIIGPRLDEVALHRAARRARRADIARVLRTISRGGAA